MAAVEGQLRMSRVYNGVGLLERAKLLAGRPARQRGDEVDVALAVDVLAEADAASQIEAGDQLRRKAVDLAEPSVANSPDRIRKRHA